MQQIKYYTKYVIFQKKKIKNNIVVLAKSAGFQCIVKKEDNILQTNYLKKSHFYGHL